MTIQIQSRVITTPTPEFVSLKDLRSAIQSAFDAGMNLAKNPTYNGIFKPAYEAGKLYKFYGPDLRGTVDSKTLLDSLSVAAEQGYLEGGEKRLDAPDLNYVPTLVDPSKTAVAALMDQITLAYVRGFDIGKASYKSIGLGGSSDRGGMLSTEGGWGAWLLGTVTIAAVVATAAVLVRNSQKD